MDCRTAKEYIYMFDSLSQEEKDEVLAHARNCKECTQELIDSARLRDELSDIDEVEAPAGLALSAIAKAKKKVKIPSYAYISVAAAAVIAVAFFISSDMIGTKTRTTDDTMAMTMEESADSGKSNGDVFESEQSLNMDTADEDMTAADSYAADDTIEEAALDQEDTVAEDEAVDTSTDSADTRSVEANIIVPVEKAEFADRVAKFLADKDIYSETVILSDDTEQISFVVGEINLEEFKAILEEYEIYSDAEISAGTLVYITIEN